MHATAEELAAGLDHVRAAPRAGGRLEAIVVRPDREEREVLGACRLDRSGGAEGDRWVRGLPSPPRPGTPDVETQITLMNARAAELVARDRDRWGLAGDQLYVDFDLSEDHLRPGDRLRIGEVVLEVTGKAHNGCRKFAARYGAPALEFVNSTEGRRLHLRGIYACVLAAGIVRVGDGIDKLPAAAGTSPDPRKL